MLPLILLGIAVAVAAIAAYRALRGASRDADCNFSNDHVGSPVQGCPARQSLSQIADAVNPQDSTINCGNVIDAVVARTSGSDVNAVAPATQDGSFTEIEARHHTTLVWRQSFEQAFDTINASPEGTTAILGINYGPPQNSSHVVAIIKRDGVASIVEGQDWGPNDPREVITTPQRANERYNQSGQTTVGLGVIP